MADMSERKRARFYIPKKQKILRYVFIYKKPDTFQKARQFPLRFIYKKLDTLRYAIVHEILEVGTYIQNYDTLSYVTLLYTKRRYLAKRNTIYA